MIMIMQNGIRYGEINDSVIRIIIALLSKSTQDIAHSIRVVSICPISDEKRFRILPLGFLSKNSFLALITL